MEKFTHKNIALWSLTRKGTTLVERIGKALDKSYQTKIFIPASLSHMDTDATPFNHLKEAVAKNFVNFGGHVFVMATGIAVRMIAPLIRHKTKDPAVVVMDERGRYAISLLSGHIGGANSLTREIASAVGALPVITTATDINGLPAIDEIAASKGLVIENPREIKTIHMALLEGERIRVYDPFGLIRNELQDKTLFIMEEEKQLSLLCKKWAQELRPGVFVDEKIADLPRRTLVIRPRQIVAGIGCNRNTPTAEILGLIQRELAARGISADSLAAVASIEIKKDEPGLIEAADKLDVPIFFYSSEALNRVQSIQNPSETVRRVTGAKSVCEAAAILAAQNGPLIVPKIKTKNVTLAMARARFMSSA